MPARFFGSPGPALAVPVPPPVSILLVDDEPRNVIALEAALSRADCGLVKAHSGSDALKCVLAQDFAVILLDVQMVGMDGFETAGLIPGAEQITLDTNYFPDRLRSGRGARPGGLSARRHRLYLQAVRPVHSALEGDFLRRAVPQDDGSEQVTADLELREQQVVALNEDLEARVTRRTAALAEANIALEAEAVERLRAEATLRAVEHAARAEAELAAERASVLAEVSRVLVEDFMDHRPMLGRVAHIASLATDTACVIQLIAEDDDVFGVAPLASITPIRRYVRNCSAS